MKLNLKIYVAVFLSLIIGLTFFYLNNSTKQLLQTHAIILHKLNDLQITDQKINREVLNVAFRLYDTYDDTNLLLQNARQVLDKLLNTPLLKQPDYIVIRNKLQAVKQSLKHKDQTVQKFTTLNALLKNSRTHIPSLSSRYMEKFGASDHDYLLELAKITSIVFLAHNSMDADMLKDIDKSISKLKTRQFEGDEKNEFNRVFLSHVTVFSRYMPLFRPVFNEVINNPLEELIHQAELEFNNVSAFHAQQLSLISTVFTVVFIVSITMIVILLFNAERNHRAMFELHQELKSRATRDPVTQLSNRFKLQQDEKQLDGIHTFFLLNLDGFKNINDFYGRQTGDEVLKHIGDILQKQIPENVGAKLYRLGADEFGILAHQASSYDLHSLVENIVKHLESTPLEIGDNQLDLQFSVGISQTPPLLETADIALREVKLSRRKFLSYTKNQELENRAKNNLLMINTIKQAIRDDGIIPFFMPIMRNSDQKITAYECLMRIKNADGKLIFPDQFLPVAKKGRLYGELTRIMFRKSLEAFADNQLLFSVNLSIEDIEDHNVTNFMIEQLRRFPGIGERLTLEILESEGVDNYEQLQQFVIKIRKFGCKIAIDDYGTGYSNLQHLVNLDIDSLKLDGSLIKPILTDSNSRLAIKAIGDLANDLGINQTIAEFVGSKEVLDKVITAGISYSQGFLIGPPRDRLINQPDFLENEKENT